MSKLYRIVSKRRRDPEDRRRYLYSYPIPDGDDWGWTGSIAHADTFTKDAALRYARTIRRQWKLPARVEAVS